MILIIVTVSDLLLRDKRKELASFLSASSPEVSHFCRLVLAPHCINGAKGFPRELFFFPPRKGQF